MSIYYSTNSVVCPVNDSATTMTLKLQNFPNFNGSKLLSVKCMAHYNGEVSDCLSNDCPVLLSLKEKLER